MGFYLIGPLVILIPLGSISSWAFQPYCDDGLLGISPTHTWRQACFEPQQGAAIYTQVDKFWERELMQIILITGVCRAPLFQAIHIGQAKVLKSRKCSSAP